MYKDLDDKALIGLIQSGDARKGEAALAELYRRYQDTILKWVRHKRAGVDGEVLSSDVIREAAGEYDLKREGAPPFRNFLLRCLSNAFLDEIRKVERRRSREQRSIQLRRERGANRPSDTAEFWMREEVEPLRSLAREALLRLKPRSAQFILLEVWLGREKSARCAPAASRESPNLYAHLRELFPEYTEANLRQIKVRARQEYLGIWQELCGDLVDDTIQVFADVLELDTRRIQDEAARRAFEEWYAHHFRLQEAAQSLHLGVVEMRERLKRALDSIAGGALRGVGRMGRRESEEDRALRLARSLLGFAPIEEALDTLGNFVRRRLTTSADHRKACRALQLSPPDLQRLLADELEPAKDLWPRLARFLRVPQKRLRALQR